MSLSHEQDRLQQQVLSNTSDIAQLTATVGQLANTVERHERMMVAGFDKLESSLGRGLSELNSKFNDQVTNSRPPWWQLFLTIATGTSVFGGGLLAIIIFLNGAQDRTITTIATEVNRLSVAVADNAARDRAQDAIDNNRSEELSRIHSRQDAAHVRDWELMKQIKGG